MKLIFVILFLSCFACYSQTVRCNPFYVPTSVNLFLDLYPSATIAFSLRKLRVAYTGSCIRVRRSNDNTEQDVGFVDNYLDTASLKTFVGANNGFVTKWYDQSGSGNDFSQTTAASQPQIINTGVVNRYNGIACLSLVGRHLLSSGVLFNGGTFSFICAYTNHSNTTLAFYGNRNGSTGWNYAYNSTPQYTFLTFGTGSASASINLSQQTKHLSFLTRVSTTNSLWINSTNSGTGTGSYTSTTGAFYIGRGGVSTGTQGIPNGDIYEIIGYTSDKSTDRTAMETNVNNFYSLY